MKKLILFSAIAVLALATSINSVFAKSYTIYGPSEIDLSACNPNGPTGTVVIPFWIMRDPALSGPAQIHFNNLPIDVKVSFASQLNFNGVIAELLMATFSMNAGINFPDNVIELQVSDGANTVINQVMLHGTCPRHNRDFTVRGSFHSDNARTIFPVEGALVEIYREVPWALDQKVNSGFTDSAGAFEIHLWADREDTYYAKLRLNDVQGVYLHEAGNPQIKDYNSVFRGSNSSPVIDVGTTVIKRDGGRGTPNSSIWQGGRVAFQEFLKSIGTPPPTGDYEIVIQYTSGLTPYTGRSTTNWEDGYYTGYRKYIVDPYFNQFRIYSTNFHEFGHALRHTVDGDQPHLSKDIGKYLYVREHNYCGSKLIDIEGFAFNEGWAEYWEGTQPEYVSDACLGINLTDMTKEGAVAVDMFWLSRTLDNCIPIPMGSAADSERTRRKLMFAVINRGQNIMHSQGEFRSNFSQQYPGCTLPLPGGLGVTHHSATIPVPRQHDPLYASQVLRTRIKALEQYKVVLQKEIANARIKEKQILEKIRFSCDSCVATITKPAILAGKLKYAQFLTRVFQKKYAFMHRKEIYADNYQSIEKETKRAEEEYIKTVMEINRQTLTDCYNRLKKYFPKDNDKITWFQRRIKMMDLHTPKNDDAYMLEELPESVSADKTSKLEKGTEYRY